MEIRQLEYFVAVAEELSFTRAADKVYTVQSTISAAIKNLEDEVGVELIDRSVRRRLRLTPPGEAFLPVARQTLQAFTRAHQFALDLAPGLRGQLTVGTMTSLQLVDFPRLFAAYRSRYPLVDFRLRVSQSGSTGLADAVRNHELDVALVSLPADQLRDLSSHEVCRIACSLFVSPHHRLAGARGVHLGDLSNEDFIETPLGFGTRILADQAFERRRLSRRMVFEIADLRTIADYVAQNLGVALLPRVGFFPAHTVVEVPIIDLEMNWTLSVVHRDQGGGNRVVKAFLDLLPEFVAEGVLRKPPLFEPENDISITNE